MTELSPAEAKRKMANLIERAVIEWATDVAPWVRVGLISPDQILCKTISRRGGGGVIL